MRPTLTRTGAGPGTQGHGTIVPDTHGRTREIVLFWFMLIALVAVVAAVALAVLGNGGTLPEAEHDRLDDPLPPDRPVRPEDLEALRLAVAPRGYRMSDVDDVLDRVGAELAERDARIAELEAALAGAREAAAGGRSVGRQPYGPEYGAGAPAYGGPPGYGDPAGRAVPPPGPYPGQAPGHPRDGRDPWGGPGE